MNRRKFQGKLIAIKNCLPDDAPKVRALCAETGFLGEPIDSLFEDRKWFADLNTRYYLKYEPDSCFVAEADGELIGYVLGCRKPTQYALVFYFLIAIPLFLKALLKCLTRQYSSRSRRFLWRLIARGSRERPKRPRGCGHLHINIKDGYRHYGIGRSLFEALFHHFLKRGITKAYGELTFVERRQSMDLYMRDGLLIYDKKPTSIWGETAGNAYLMTVVVDIPRVLNLKKQ